MFNIDKIYTF